MLSEFKNCKNINEKNAFFIQKTKEVSLLNLSNSEKNELARICFQVFYENFEKRTYSMMEQVSKYCKKIVDDFLEKKAYEESECAETILDIVCFIYVETYMEEDRVKVLKTLIESNTLNISLKTRALENILLPDMTILIKQEEAERYSSMFQELKRKTGDGSQ